MIHSWIALIYAKQRIALVYSYAEYGWHNFLPVSRHPAGLFLYNGTQFPIT